MLTNNYSFTQNLSTTLIKTKTFTIMATNDDERARVFLRTSANELSNGYKLVTVHLVVRDNRNQFFFVENTSSTKSTKGSTVLNYKVIDYDSIVITDYPDSVGDEAPYLAFLFSTDSDVCKEYKDFEMFIQFCTKDITAGKKALTIKGLRLESQSAKPILKERETDEGIIYFPDIT